MGFQLENEALWESTERSHGPGNDQHQLCSLGVGYVRYREQDCREAVKRDDNQDEARDVESKNPEEDHYPAGEIISHPGDCGIPG